MKLHLLSRNLLRMSATAWFVLRSLRHRHHHRPADADGHAALRGSAQSTLPGGCFDGVLSWRGVDGEMRVNGKTFHLKGVSWFGMETDRQVVEGLDVQPLNEILNFLQGESFNAIRLPFSLKFALSYDDPVTGTVFKVRG
jgi:hypothetical protein